MLINKTAAVLKRSKDLLNSNTKLGTSVSILKSNFKANLSFQHTIIEKSKPDEILGV